MIRSLHCACIQMTAGPDLVGNLDLAGTLIGKAASRLDSNAQRLIATPEMTSGLPASREQALAAALPMEGHPAIEHFSSLAQATASWLLIGSIAVSLPDEVEKLANRSLLFDPTGQLVSWYDKIHMFDVEIGDGQTYRESATYRPGTCAVLADLDGIGLGMTICYDLRFPALYRQLARQGADLLAIPAAFTVPTGQAHWSVLLRAQAIETGCFVIAPAQTGEHEGGRRTYGHAMIIDPWGEVLAEAGSDPGIITARLDMAQVAQARRRIPSLSHDHAFT